MEGELTGVLLDGRYRVLEPISEGAMGVVYRAERVKLGRIVAIKVLHDELPAELSSRERFEIEAMAMAKLEHPHCAAVIDVGVHDGKPFVVMDFVSGDNLRDVISHGPLPLSRAVEIARQVLTGLAHAHEHNIIHRDIKPANIVLSQKSGLGDHVKILDFGLARITDTPKLTTGIVVGTPAYMAPEQIRGVLIDHRADIYATGVLLFELLTGMKPFVSEQDDPVEVCSMHLKNPPPALKDKQPGIEFGVLEGIVAKALAKKPEDRYANAVEFATALDAVPRRASIRPSAPVSVPIASVATETGWAVPEAKSSMPSEAVPLGGSGPTTAPSVVPNGPSGPATAPVAAPIPMTASEPVTAPTPPPAAPMAWVAASEPPPAAPARKGKLPPTPFARSSQRSSPRGVEPLAAPAAPSPIDGGWSGPVASPAADSSPATPSHDPAAALAAAEAAAPAPSSPPRGLPSDFDLSAVIPRGSPAGANEKGLSPAFDLSVAIPSPAALAPGFDVSLAIPQAESPVLERSGSVSGPTASPPSGPTSTGTKLGLVAAKGAAETQPGVPFEPRLPAVLTAGPDAPTHPDGAPPLADVKATAMFVGAPPAGPSPLMMPDAPEAAEAVALPAPPTLPGLPVSKKQLKVIAAVAAVLVLLAIIVGTCGKSSNTQKPSAATATPEPTKTGADDELAQITEMIETGKSRAATDRLVEARKKFPNDARLSYLLGTVYFERQLWTQGLKQFRDTLALDPTYRSDPDLIRAVLKAFITPTEYPAELGVFLREDIGAPARQYLEETAAKHPRAGTRTRAKAELVKMH